MTPAETAEALTQHLTQCADEHVARAYGGDPTWSLPGSDDVFEVDEDVVEGPVELVRRSDGARFCADVTVTVWEKRS